MKKEHSKAPVIIAVVFAALFVIISALCIFFFQFTEIGYRMSVTFRPSFEKIDDNVYVNKLDDNEKDEIPLMTGTIDEAKKRVGDSFGELESESNTVIILCDDENTLKKLGGDHDTKTVFFPSLGNYISVSPDYFNTDVLAHEITHAELHTRLNAAALKKLPTWFDEGLAMQNDNRKRYSESAWEELTDNGENVIDLRDMDTPDEFYSGGEDDTRPRYICAKHEVGKWMERHGREGLLELIDKLNSGEDFYTVYDR